MPESGMDKPGRPTAPAGIADRIEHWILLVLLAVMAGELVVAVVEGQWMTAFLVLLIMLITLAPVVFEDRISARLPSEFQTLAVLFVFASLFLGEIRSFYERIWWWDIALHGCSGLLLGIVGFLLVYVLNENRHTDVHMRPRFVALFAFVFALAVGATWEIFEFAMDGLFGMEMQKPILGDPSGLSDTMWDLIVDALGALIVSGLGWWYLRRRKEGIIHDWIGRFIERNPRLFQA